MVHAGEVFPWREGNTFRLLLDGPGFFPAMLAAIEGARCRVDLEMYLVEEGECTRRMVEVLAGASERGVRVRCLFDGFGSLLWGPASRQRLLAAGVELRLYNPLSFKLKFNNLHRDHRKLLLVDGERGYVGGTGLTDRFWSPDGARQWHEAMVEMTGPLLTDWQRLFDTQWVFSRRKRIWQIPLPRRQPRLPALPEAQPGLGRVAYAAARQHRDILQSLLRHLHRAEDRIWLATPYFLPTGKVRRALIRAARRGVEVRLLLTGRNTDNPPVRYAGQRYYPRLLRAGVRIHEYQPQFLHLKMVLVDDWVSIGSCNFDHWNLRWNLEANLESMDSALVREVAASFAQDFTQSIEVDMRSWRARPLLTRVYQRLWGMLDKLVINIFNRSGRS
ncbi:phosphatidylserine/phosphatidylglycerophosphate/cardiolipin synthase family protein [Pseudomonas sp. ABC1]|uniref:phospholipase D-like domain-containing protein n=1 Tax=Pseudomonas sp. ABC1 TaxID=2748080 RepID=UPI00211A8576|nr:phosphatidylserine/phosphatidylglycerophosphate/cardiolipin synthase family protein [Pseudomonas sp. ABC1]